MSLIVEDNITDKTVALYLAKNGDFLSTIGYDHDVDADFCLDDLKDNNAELNLLKDDKKKSWFMPALQDRISMFICGSSGAGKTYFIRNIAMIYKMMNPKNKVYMISSKETDITLERKYADDLGTIGGHLKYKQIVINEDNHESMTWELMKDQLKNSLVIFDDCIFTDKKVMSSVLKLQERVLNLGRDRDIGVIISKHVLQDAQNRIIKNATKQIVIFPQYSSTKHIRDYLKSLGFSKQHIRKVVNTNSRWVLVNTTFPKIVITQNQIFKQ